MTVSVNHNVEDRTELIPDHLPAWLLTARPNRLTAAQMVLVGWLVGWLVKMFNAGLSLKRYWRGPRPHEVGEEGDYT